MNIFKKLFKRKNNPYALQLKGNTLNYDSQDLLIKQINKLDENIRDTSKELIKSQIVRFRSLLSNNRSLFSGIQRKMVEVSAKKSVIWYEDNLRRMYMERRTLQNKLDKINGTFWSKKLYKFVFSAVFISLLLLLSFVSLMGLFAIFYYLPLILIVLLVCYLFKSNVNKL